MFAVLAHHGPHQLAPDIPRRTASHLARQSFDLIWLRPVRSASSSRRLRWVMWFVVPLVEVGGAGLTPVATGRAGSAIQLDQEPT